MFAFRHLVRKQWEKDGRRPDTRAIQRILYKQICGFDVSEPALRLAALALYITAIEVNGTTRPPKSLKMPRPLQNEVLFNFGQANFREQRGFEIGSLGPQVPELCRYRIVAYRSRGLRSGAKSVGFQYACAVIASCCLPRIPDHSPNLPP